MSINNKKIMHSVKTFKVKDKPQRLDYTFTFPQKTKRKFIDEQIKTSFVKK